MNIAVITGTSRGLGRELAARLLDSGYRVTGVSRSESSIDHDHYHHLVADVTGPGYVETLAGYLRQLQVTRVDCVINNAGTGSSGMHIDEVEAEEVARQIDVHCLGSLRTVKALHSLLDKSVIVNITSRLGSTRFSSRGDFIGREFSYGYRIAKAAQNMLSLVLAEDERLKGNRVLSIVPGLLKTGSGSSDAKFSATDGAEAVIQTMALATVSGVYHAFGEEAAW